jgi:hypothetical protein
MLTTQHFGTIDDADGDSWINVAITVDATLSVQEVRLTGSTADIQARLSPAQLDQVRALIHNARHKLVADLRRNDLEQRAEEYWQHRA